MCLNGFVDFDLLATGLKIFSSYIVLWIKRPNQIWQNCWELSSNEINLNQ